MLTKLKTTTAVEAKVLSELFPSSSSVQKRPLKVFDPTAECVALPQQKKKKAARQKSLSVDVFLLPRFSRNVPKRKDRKALKDAKRNKKISITRQMSTQQVKNTILREFGTDFTHLKNFTVLECEANNLLKHASFELNGSNIAERRGTLYLCEVNSTDGEVYIHANTCS